MSVKDISRFLHQPGRHYSGARLQQGRAVIDSDFNEEARADDEELRRALAALVGPQGSPDDGFMPELSIGQTVTAEPILFGGAVPLFVLNFGLRPGTIHVGGMRFDLERSEPVVFQKDFLQMAPGDAPLAEIGTRHHLVFLRGFEQCVSAVEDEEILERGMGGADATVRVRRMRRVEVRRVEPAEPDDAFAEVIGHMTEGGVATFDEETAELKSNARMHIEFVAPEVVTDCPPCEPSPAGQYLGSENHTIRIMLATASSYVWAFDNAAPLYRVKVFLTGAQARVEMLTPPKDEFHFPTENAVVEFLPWSALLDNGEKAATEVGFFGEVVTPYSASSRTFKVQLTLDTLSDLGFFARKVAPGKAKNKAVLKTKTGGADRIHSIALRWDPRHPQASSLNPTGSDDEGVVAFVYMRIWHKRAAIEPFFIPTSSGLPLGRTGLVPRFDGLGRPGDYWTLAVRPSAPTEVVPRDLLRPEGVPPHGPREFLAPLSLIEWESLNPFVHRVKSLLDTRSPFSPLAEGTCCTFVVSKEGSGFTSIQAAIDALPDSGGRVCVQPGVYEEEIFIDRKSQVTLEGCGPDTVIESPDTLSGDSLLQILGPDDSDASVAIRNLTLRAHGQTGILASGEKITLRDLTIEADAGDATQTLPAISVLAGRDVRIIGNRITMDGSRSDHAAVYVEAPALGALIEDNRIETLQNQSGDLSFAWGGLHVAGGSRDVEIRRNHIIGGLGHGITLGSVVFRGTDGTQLLELRRQGAGRGQTVGTAPPIVTGDIQFIVEDDEDFFPDPEDDLENILIAENRIEAMANSGIATLAVFVEHDELEMGPPLCISKSLFGVRRLTILDNHITDNARNSPENVEEPHAVGGIVLSRANELTVRNNHIVGNGPESDHPLVGVFVASGDNLAFEANHLRRNGAALDVEPEFSDLRGGLVVFPADLSAAADDFALLPSRVFVRNNIIEQTEGPALFLFVHGECAVLGNYLFSGSRFSSVLDSELGQAAIVFNAGAPWESVDLLPGEPSTDRWEMSPDTPSIIIEAADTSPTEHGGLTSFHDNVVNAHWIGGPQATTGLVVASTSGVSAKGNQLSLRATVEPVGTHAAIVGELTVIAAKNRIADTVDATATSGQVFGTLAAGVHNITTHCLFVDADGTNPIHFANHGNLVLLKPPGGCGGGV